MDDRLSQLSKLAPLRPPCPRRKSLTAEEAVAAILAIRRGCTWEQVATVLGFQNYQTLCTALGTWAAHHCRCCEQQPAVEPVQSAS